MDVDRVFLCFSCFVNKSIERKKTMHTHVLHAFLRQFQSTRNFQCCITYDCMHTYTHTRKLSLSFCAYLIYSSLLSYLRDKYLADPRLGILTMESSFPQRVTLQGVSHGHMSPSFFCREAVTRTTTIRTVCCVYCNPYLGVMDSSIYCAQQITYSTSQKGLYSYGQDRDERKS